MTTNQPQKTDSAGLAYKYGYQAAAEGQEKQKPYKDETKNKAWVSGYNQSCKDFDIK